MPETKATLRYLRTSAYKVREVLGLIRGLDIAEARHALQYCDRAVARDVLKVLDSAVANAENTLNIPADELFVSVAFADEGPTIKRWRPRARGRATRIRKRTSHITIYVARLSDAQLAQRNRRDAASASGGRRRGVLPGRRRRADQKAPAPAPEVEAGEHDHDHDHDHEHDEATEAPAAEVTAPEVTAAEDAVAEEAPAAEVEEAPEAAAEEPEAAADEEEKEGE